ncbi:uncharacterized protein LOC134006183 [Scomber scombrus]|uniref:uncharacterized protein LOC134006183 n=1 Tax=Scomber scombrus TaxID=13677 RepID=UPI002DD8D66A|nr:uncharacterized protein LOC134006183 [Scomber scombrus]
MFTFEESITLRADKNVTIWAFGCGFHNPPSYLRWNDLKCWTKGDKLLVELINCHEEIVKTTETQDVSKQNNTNPAGKNSTEILVEIDPDGKYLFLTNESKEDLKLEGWKLRVKLNHENPIMFTFEESITLRAEEKVTIWAFGCGFHNPPSDLVWKELNRWTKGDKLLVELINCHEEIVKTTESPDISQHNDTNPAGKNSTEVFVEIDPNGKYLCLFNKSKEDLKLEGRKLRVKLNHENPIMFTFEKSISLRAEKSVTIWAHGYGFHHPPSDLKWKELRRLAEGDKLLVELINCHEEIMKTTETQGASQHNDTNPAGKNSTEVFVEIDPNGKYLRLTNKSKEDLKLEGWKLRVTVNDENSIMFTFEESFILRAEEKVYIWPSGTGFLSPGPSNLKWKDLKRWNKGDKLLVELINCHEEIMKTTETQHNDTNPSGKNSTDVFLEFDPDGKYLCVTNKSKEDLKLEGWKLRVKLNDQNPIMFTFEESITLRAEEKVYIGVDDYGFHHPPSDLLWKDLKHWNKGDKLLVELINCHEEIMKTTETQGASKHKDTNPAGKNLTEFFVEVDPNGKYLRLTNESKEDLKLEGWKLRVKLNDKNPIMYTFEESITLRPEKSVTIWVPGFGFHSPPSNLTWKDLKHWAKGDKLLVELIKCHEEIVTTTEEQRKEQTEKEVETLKKELQTKQEEFDAKTKELDRKQTNADRLLQEEKQNREKEVKDLKNQLDSKQKELEKIIDDWSPFSDEEDQQRKEQTEKEVETLKKELQTKQKEFETKTKELDGKQTNADRPLQEEKPHREKEVKDLKNQLDLKTKEVENKQAECDLTELQQPHEENQRRERELQTLKENLETKTKELETIIENWSPFSDEEEEQRKEQTEKEVETLKKELQTKQEEFETKTKERPNVSQHNDTNLADQNSTEVFVEFDPNGKYLRLTNKSKEDLKLEGWMLRVKLNDENPIMYTFKKSFKLRAEKKVTIWVPGSGFHLPPSNLTWKELKRWNKGDKLLVELINCHEEIVKTTEV